MTRAQVKCSLSSSEAARNRRRRLYCRRAAEHLEEGLQELSLPGLPAAAETVGVDGGDRGAAVKLVLLLWHVELDGILREPRGQGGKVRARGELRVRGGGTTPSWRRGLRSCRIRSAMLTWRRAAEASAAILLEKSPRHARVALADSQLRDRGHKDGGEGVHQAPEEALGDLAELGGIERHICGPPHHLRQPGGQEKDTRASFTGNGHGDRRNPEKRE